jgi:arylsulfatase A-like enzyme
MQAWAAAEYLDAVIGRVLDFVASSRLAANTYVMLASDNGAQLLDGEEQPAAKLVGSRAGVSGVFLGGSPLLWWDAAIEVLTDDQGVVSPDFLPNACVMSNQTL